MEGLRTLVPGGARSRSWPLPEPIPPGQQGPLVRHEDDPWWLMPSTGGHTVTTEQSLAVSVVTFPRSVLSFRSRVGGE